MASTQRNKRPRVAPYKLLMLILYGQHKWITRAGGMATFPVPMLAKNLRTRAHRVQEYMEILHSQGFIDYQWHKHIVNVKITPPVGMAFVAEHSMETIDVK